MPCEANVTPFCPVIFVLTDTERLGPQPSAVGVAFQMTPGDAPKSSVPLPSNTSGLSVPRLTCLLKMTPA